MKMPKDRLDLRKEIASLSPFRAKTSIRDKEKFPWRNDWNQRLSITAMTFSLKHKFKKGTSWANKLLKTEDWKIVEWNNWNDIFWGKDIKTRQGENNLGKIIMNIRHELRSNII